MAKLAAIAALSLFACKGDGATKIEPKPIGQTGFVVDAPADWLTKQDASDIFSMGGSDRDSPRVTLLVRNGVGMATADALAPAVCDDATKANKETLPGGGLVISCPTSEGQPAGKLATKVHVMIHANDKLAECWFASDRDVATLSSLCRSLRPAKP